PYYRAWVVVFSVAVCAVVWFQIERTRLGALLRAATENPTLVRAFGVNVPRMITLTYGLGVALAAVAGVLAAPIYSVPPRMGAVRRVPGVPDGGAVLRAVRVRLQPVAGTGGAAVLRARAVLRGGGVRGGGPGQDVGAGDAAGGAAGDAVFRRAGAGGGGHRHP